jgi:excisionase family DNA binding protein
MTLPEAARYLGVSEDSIRRWIKDDKLPAVKLAGKYRISPSDLDAMVQQRRKAA